MENEAERQNYELEAERVRQEMNARLGTSNEGKVLSRLEACFDLISSPSPSMKIQIIGGKITENLGFESPLQKVKKNFDLFLL